VQMMVLLKYFWTVLHMASKLNETVRQRSTKQPPPAAAAAAAAV